MQINKKQEDELGGHKVENFINLSIAFLKDNFPVYCEGKTSDDIRDFVISVIELGNRYDIKKGINLQKLMHYRIEFGFTLPLHKKLEVYLTDPGLNESTRLDNFCLNLLSGRYKMTEIVLLEKNNG